jgi:competence protein ComEC
VIFYIILIGLQPSAIRAGIMGIILLLAQAVGRLSDGWRMVIFALSIMLLFNPLLLRYDIGFQLSFLAVCGIIFLSPVFNHWLKFIPEEKFWNLKEAIVITLSAQVFTLPLLIFNFGYFSVISPFVNAIIDPLIYYITGLGLFLGSMGKILMPLGKILAIPAYVLLDIVIKTINFFSSFDWAYKTFKISWVWLSFSYLLLFIVTKELNKRYNSPLLLKLKKL